MTIECLQIEPTTRCNFTCGFCCGRSMPQSDIDFETFERTLAAFPQVRHLDLQGEGEPLMHPRFFDMVDRARGRGIRVSFVSNGSYFTPENVERILRGGIEKISVSLESADAATFRALRGGKLEKVIAGLEHLIGERNRRGLVRPVVGFSITMLRGTTSHLAGILDLYRRLGLDGGVTTQPLQRMPAYLAGYDPAMAAQMLDADAMEALYLRFDRKTRALMNARRSTESFHDHLMADWRPTSRTCPWLERGLYVDRNGMATACCMIKHESFALGRVGTDGAETILARREAMRAQLARGQTPAACQGCEIARYAVMGRFDLARRMVRGSLRVVREGWGPDELCSTGRGDSSPREGDDLAGAR